MFSVFKRAFSASQQVRLSFVWERALGKESCVVVVQELCVPRLPGNKPTLYSQPSLWGVRSSDIFPMKCQESDLEIPGGAGGAHPTPPLLCRAQSHRRTGAGYSSFPPTLWPWLEPAHELCPPQFPSSVTGCFSLQKTLGRRGQGDAWRWNQAGSWHDHPSIPRA